MNINTKYIYKTNNGFKYTFENPNEALQHFEADFTAINNLIKECNKIGEWQCNKFLDNTNKYFPKGCISAYIDGEYKFYELITEVRIKS